MANIAEGSSRVSEKDFAHFIRISYSSLMEVLSHFYAAFDLHIYQMKNYIRLKKKVCIFPINSMLCIDRL
ncbi:MAG: four helix bundle protein [Candidatus Marinimicrobia bacterium]|nr:four helix bundle protein [Candidatus Neomarinimicrobiota bacterium]